ncbi:MAG TPA: inositol monophosphatase family protein [Verrucomicrobiae bacterium]|nr:inositol monophosphatase family protein [Verrucomicrobiae bacterium]
MNIDIQDVIVAVRAGGAVVKQYFGEVLQTEEKSNVGDLRTKADTLSEQAIITTLQHSFPDFNIYAEESGQIDNGSEYTFVIDPLDGTSNFVLGIPDFSISIGLLKGSDAVLGVIYNPILDRLYSAQKGTGAYLNGKQIHVNHETDTSRITVSYTCGYNTSRAYSDDVKGKLLDLPVKRILETWAPAYDYCLLASGRLEAVVSKEGGLEDYVAAKIIVTEAGGKVTSFKNEPVDGRAADFVATNDTSIHEKLTSLL